LTRSMLLAAAVFLAASASAQTASAVPVPEAAAYPEDGKSIDSIIAAAYEVISGDAGVKRDWSRFRALYYPGAQLIPTGLSRKSGKPVARMITPETYLAGGPQMEAEGFHEREVARKVESYGHIAHAFSTYEARHRKEDAQPFMRGINSFQLYNDSTRWWILNIAWSPETPDSLIPAHYLSPN
jgi:hypothetical protein